MTELVQPSLDAAGLARHAQRLVESADAPNTRRAYASDLAAWCSWCASTGVDPHTLPVAPEHLAAWLTSQHAAGMRPATLRHRAAWMGRVHRDAVLMSPAAHPLVRALLRGAAREGPPVRKKAPITLAMLRAAAPELDHLHYTLALVAIVTGLRRADLSALRWDQLRPAPFGLVIVLGRTKTHAAGEVVHLPRAVEGRVCPVAALEALREQSSGDAIFGCRPDAVAKLAKQIAQLNGQEPAAFGGHSFRAGMLTEAGRLGISLAPAMAQSGHASASIAAAYTRHAPSEANPAAAAIVAGLNSPVPPGVPPSE